MINVTIDLADLTIYGTINCSSGEENTDLQVYQLLQAFLFYALTASFGGRVTDLTQSN